MRQAGRYLPEYRKLKEKYTFTELVKSPELATEVTLQPLKRFSLDAAIIFSDILVIPEALGQPYSFRETGGIQMEYALDSEDKIKKLDPAGVEEKLSYVAKALKLVRNEIGDSQTLLGFGGSPWTLATYMVEGGSSKEFSKVKTLAYENPALFEALMQKLTQALIDYFKMQIEAGVDAIQIFDSWGAACTGSTYQDFSLKWVKTIIDALPKDFPIIFYAKGMAHHLPSILKTGAKVVSVDWTVNMDELKATHPGSYAIQGNLDPTLLNTTPNIVKEAALDILEKMKGHPGHIFNLGHGIMPEAKIENVEALLQTVIEFGN